MSCDVKGTTFKNHLKVLIALVVFERQLPVTAKCVVKIPEALTIAASTTSLGREVGHPESECKAQENHERPADPAARGAVASIRMVVSLVVHSAIRSLVLILRLFA